ncbi:MlaE family ABC transporter permease [Patulibacter minatonensis]|uniref:MlaE family ABC transporter permease n=1 Tax=Patulibacter minatonensis TaxID=298163 RepID=UPI000479C1C5|nr:ABC transporter permease [Patulibacter minatonensis]
MEAGNSPAPYQPAGAGRKGTPTGLERFAGGFVDPVRNILVEAGQIGAFAGRSFLELRGTLRYSAEMMRQVALLITGSAMVLWAMQFTFGLTCGNEAVYVLRGYGASSYAGVFSAICPVREATPFMFAYMIGAKIGCGYVAELGSMRINEEIDAMESLGINPMRYLVGTRLLANILVSLPIFISGLVLFYLGEVFVILFQIGEISRGAWESVHWAFTDAPSVIFSYLKTLVMWVAIVIAAMYYGINAKGGPVGVGEATARSMVVALILTMVLNEGFTILFWGADSKLPVGG